MPDSVFPRRVAACAGTLLAIAGTLLATSPRSDAAALAELRVEGPSGTLDPGTWYVTGGERIRRSKPSDRCVRTRGKVRVPGATALGLAQTGAESNPGVRQVRIRSDEAGLFVCEIGSVLGRPFTDPAGFAGWSFYQGFVFGSSAADQVKLADDDRILWVYSDFGAATPANTGSTLELQQVPAGDQDGQFRVKVVAHEFDGDTVEVDDATIEGATAVAPVGSDGLYDVAIAQGTTTLRATRGLDVASNRLDACYQPAVADCPAEHGRTIVGSDGDDAIAGTGGWDEISTRRGRDRIDLTAGGRDRVGCGGGDRDRVRVAAGDDDDVIAASCERVREVT
jgi:hypothetical protein